MRTEAGVERSTDENHGGGERTERDIDDDLEPHDAQTLRQAAGTRLYLSTDRPSLQFAMSAVVSGMSEPIVRVARCVLQNPERLGCSTTKQTRRHCMCTRTRIGQRTN